MICLFSFVVVCLAVVVGVLEFARLENKILLLLLDGPEYGVTIAEGVGLRPEAMGLIYGVLRSMERRGFLVSTERPASDFGLAIEVQRGGRPRRYYALTPAGRALANTMRSIVWAVTAKTGKAIPIDANAAPNGNVELVPPGDPRDPPTAHMLNSKGERQTGEGGTFRAPSTRYQAHFTSCPHADQHRKGDR